MSAVAVVINMQRPLLPKNLDLRVEIPLIKEIEQRNRIRFSNLAEVIIIIVRIIPLSVGTVQD